MLCPPGMPLPVTFARALAPDRQHVVEPVHRAVVGPKHVQRTADPLVEIRLVVLQVDRRARAIVLAHRVHACGRAVRALILGLRGCELPAGLRLALREQDVLRDRRRLQVVEPVKVRLHEVDRHVRI